MSVLEQQSARPFEQGFGGLLLGVVSVQERALKWLQRHAPEPTCVAQTPREWVRQEQELLMVLLGVVAVCERIESGVQRALPESASAAAPKRPAGERLPPPLHAVWFR